MSGISEWRQSVPYTAGSVVTYKGRKWTAKGWNQNQEPGGASGVWVPTDNIWTEGVAYNVGDVVSYNNHKWSAKQWNCNEVPGGASGAWIDNGVYPQAPRCPAPWYSNHAYTRGDTVSYEGHKWTANQWNYNEVPGGTSGAWDDNGRCY